MLFLLPQRWGYLETPKEHKGCSPLHRARPTHPDWSDNPPPGDRCIVGLTAERELPEGEADTGLLLDGEREEEASFRGIGAVVHALRSVLGNQHAAMRNGGSLSGTFDRPPARGLHYSESWVYKPRELRCECFAG